SIRLPVTAGTSWRVRMRSRLIAKRVLAVAHLRFAISPGRGGLVAEELPHGGIHACRIFQRGHVAGGGNLHVLCARNGGGDSPHFRRRRDDVLLPANGERGDANAGEPRREVFSRGQTAEGSSDRLR